MIYQEVASELHMPVSLVKKVISHIGKEIKKEIEQPQHRGVLINNFGAIYYKPYMINKTIKTVINKIRKADNERDREINCKRLRHLWALRRAVIDYQDRGNIKYTRR